MNLEREKENFKNHKAKLTDYGNIKILDFANPNDSFYRIRFLFEEDYYRLHISGDLGELTATNYCNMTYEKFNDFVNNIGYFEQKIDCCNRKIYIYDFYKTKKDIKELLEEYDLLDEVLEDYCDDLEYFFTCLLDDFSEERGIGCKGQEILEEYFEDIFEFVDDIEKKEIGILDLYMLAFKLAKEQIESNL